MSKIKDYFRSNARKVSIQVANAVSCALNFQRNMFNSTLGLYFGGNRDLYKALGYPRTLRTENYINYYKRHAIAKAVVKAYPDACWSISPEIIENEDQTLTQFEKDVSSLIKDQKLFKYMHRADRITGILTYGILLIGFKDGLTVDQPATGGDVAYFQAFNGNDARIDSYNNDPSSERFGKPEFYTITISNDNSATSQKVHWSRIIHIAEECDSGDIHGTPRMKAVYNNLYNIEKISGSGAEGYWRNGSGGTIAEFDKDAQIGETEATAFKAEMSKWVDGFEKSLVAKGGQVKALSINMQDPKQFFMTEIQQISAEKKIPQRELMGTEQSNVSSVQDSKRWLGNVSARQVGFCDTDIIRPTIDRLLELGSIASPADGEYSIVWADLETKDDKTIAETAKAKTEALVKYGDSPQTQAIFPPEVYYAMILGMSKEEIDSIDIKEEEPLDLKEKDLFPEDE